MGCLYQSAMTIADTPSASFSFWIMPPATTGNGTTPWQADGSLWGSDGSFYVIRSMVSVGPLTDRIWTDFLKINIKPYWVNGGPSATYPSGTWINLQCTDTSNATGGSGWKFPDTGHLLQPNTWAHIFLSMNNNGSDGAFCVLNGTRLSNANASQSFNIGLFGKPIGLPTQPELLDYSDGIDHIKSPVLRYADFQMWAGVFIDPTVTSNFAKFVSISGGKGTPVNPATAATAFGTQTFLFKGTHSQFNTNAGNGGAFTLSGSDSDFTPAPSY